MTKPLWAGEHPRWRAMETAGLEVPAPPADRRRVAHEHRRPG